MHTKCATEQRALRFFVSDRVMRGVPAETVLLLSEK